MPDKELTSELDVSDFVRGCAFFSTGGGGDPKLGLAFLLKVLKTGKTIAWVDSDKIDDDVWVCSPAGMGSIAPVTKEKQDVFNQLGLKEKVIEDTLIKAVLELEQYLDDKIDVIVPIEIGGYNTSVPLGTAAALDKLAVDGDYVGRAIPEAAQVMPAIYDKKITPIVCVDDWGNISIIKNTVNLDVAEKLGKMISTLAVGLCGETFFTIRGREMKEVLIPGTLTKSLKVGQMIRDVREKGESPVSAIVDYYNGWLLFEGAVVKKDWADIDGYMIGTTYINGEDEFADKKMKVWFKNENLLAWIDEKPVAFGPDLIVIVDETTGEPIINTDLTAKMSVSVIGLQSPKQHRREKNIELMGPRHYGFNYDYMPIENLNK